MLKRNTFVGCFARAIRSSPGHRLTSVLLLSLASIFGLFGLVATSHAQAISTADKGGQVEAFGAFTFGSSDYGPNKNEGGSVGGAFLLRKLIFGQPAIAARYVHLSGPTASETFFGGGLESHYRFGPVRPYVTALYGVGGLIRSSINYSDSGNTLLIGGGADIPVTPKFDVRGEVTYSSIKITGYHDTSVGAVDLNPVSVNLGIVYHIR
jgi:hypothetical protein